MGSQDQARTEAPSTLVLGASVFLEGVVGAVVSPGRMTHDQDQAGGYIEQLAVELLDQVRGDDFLDQALGDVGLAVRLGVLENACLPGSGATASHWSHESRRPIPVLPVHRGLDPRFRR